MAFLNIPTNNDRLLNKTQKMGIIHVRKRLFLCIVKFKAELS